MTLRTTVILDVSARTANKTSHWPRSCRSRKRVICCWSSTHHELRISNWFVMNRWHSPHSWYTLVPALVSDMSTIFSECHTHWPWMAFLSVKGLGLVCLRSRWIHSVRNSTLAIVDHCCDYRLKSANFRMMSEPWNGPWTVVGQKREKHNSNRTSLNRKVHSLSKI